MISPASTAVAANPKMAATAILATEFFMTSPVDSPIKGGVGAVEPRLHRRSCAFRPSLEQFARQSDPCQRRSDALLQRRQAAASAGGQSLLRSAFTPLRPNCSNGR